MTIVEWVASAGGLDPASKSAKVGWPTAVARTVGTIAEVRAFARELRGGKMPVTQPERLVEACTRLSDRLRLHVRVHGRPPDEPCVVVANHLSYLDPLAIGQAQPFSAIAKSEIMGWPGLGATLRDLGIIFVRRGCRRSGALALRKAMRLLGSGVSVLVFPEGTTTTGNDVLPFARGAFGIARLMRAPVVPATLRYELPEARWVGDDSLVPHALRLHRFDRVEADLVFGPALQPLAFESAAALAEATRQCIRSVLLP